MLRRILLLTFYYPPDLCAGSFRASALVEALQQQAAGKVEIDVITTQPNRYHSFARQADADERHSGVRVRRIRLPSHRSGLCDQAQAFLHFAHHARRLLRNEDYDLVIGTSSRLMTAVLAASVARQRRLPLYLDIRDIFAENMAELFPAWYLRPVTALFSWMERWAVTAAKRVNLVSPGFLPYFRRRYPQLDFSCHTNGIDRPFLQQHWAAIPHADRPLRVLYAGNMGEGQGLHLILPQLARALEGRVHFQLHGDGGRVAALREAVAGLDNVSLLPPMDRERLMEAYHQSDVLFLHLNDLQAFRRVLPSKLFEYAATGKPLWAGVAGFAADFIRQELRDAAVFDPCDVQGGLQAFDHLRLGWTDRSDFVARYAREHIMQLMAHDVLAMLEAS